MPTLHQIRQTTQPLKKSHRKTRTRTKKDQTHAHKEKAFQAYDQIYMTTLKN